MYSLTTPYLYRNIIIHQHQALALFGLFDTYSRQENSLFVRPIPTIHPLDLPLPQRLRLFFSHTQTLIFRLAYIPDLDLKAVPQNWDHLSRYRDVVESLWCLDQPTLWPAIRRCELDLKALSNNYIELYQDYNTSRVVPNLVSAVFTCLHPDLLTILSPTPFRDNASYDSARYWSDCLTTLQADHVQLVDRLPDIYLASPRATYSMTVYYKDSLLGDDGKSTKPLINTECMQHFCDSHSSFIDLQHLTLIGLPRLGDVTDAGTPESVTDIHDNLAKSVSWVMVLRRRYGNSEDLKITVQPDSSSEGVASAISRTYTPPDVDE
jgi:hypothetical protein